MLTMMEINGYLIMENGERLFQITQKRGKLFMIRLVKKLIFIRMAVGF